MEINDRIFITGASGFLGSLVARSISDLYPKTYLRLLVHHLPPPQLNTHPHIVQGSLLQDDINAFFSDIHVVIHCAALTATTSLGDYWQVNVEGMRNLVSAARRARVRRIIFISSRSIDEKCGYYAASKRAAENILIQSGVPYIILRFSEIYGHASRDGINKLIGLVRIIPIVPYPAGNIRIAPLWQDDAVKAIISALHIPQPTNITYTLGGPHEYRFPELIQVIAKHYSLRRGSIAIPQKIFHVFSVLARYAGISILHPDQLQRMACQKEYDNSDAKKNLHYAPIDLDKGLSLLKIAPFTK